jgi:putative hydrolase of the HAD superfamily
MFDLIAFDADDTLWHNEYLYLLGRERLGLILKSYGLDGVTQDQVDAIEIANLQHYGYGIMSFTLSLIETAVQLTAGQITGRDVQALLEVGKEMFGAEVELFEGAEAVLEQLSGVYPLLLITKGELHHQRAKLARSGLGRYFRHIEVTPDKNEQIYAEILRRYNVDPRRFLMVGNSLRSDILPVLELGGWAVYMPNELTWSHEHAEAPPEMPARFRQVEHLWQVAKVIEDFGIDATSSAHKSP